MSPRPPVPGQRGTPLHQFIAGEVAGTLKNWVRAEPIALTQAAAAVTELVLGLLTFPVAYEGEAAAVIGPVLLQGTGHEDCPGRVQYRDAEDAICCGAGHPVYQLAAALPVHRIPMPPRTLLVRRVPLRRGTGLQRAVPLQRHAVLGRRVPLRPVSRHRAAENRQRRALVDELWGGEWPLCVWPEPPCGQLADDVHEILSRARTGGLITDPSIWAPLCRPHHNRCTRGDQAAYDAGLLFHSWETTPPRGMFTGWLTTSGRLIRETGGLIHGCPYARRARTTGCRWQPPRGEPEP